MQNLTDQELVNLLNAVFPRLPEDRFLGILVDIPREAPEDTDTWRARRSMVESWAGTLRNFLGQLDLDGVRIFAYPHVGSNNADLPEFAYLVRPPLPPEAEELDYRGMKISFQEIFTKVQVFLAPTRFSATALLKNAARQYSIRAATMPGFTLDMIPALRIDYNVVNHRVMTLKNILDQAESAEATFIIDDRDECRMHFDLRHRTAHASTGRFPEAGSAGNLPSGEAYIVPYEGEKGESSKTEGTLPVQIKDEIVTFTVKENRAVEAAGKGPASEQENLHLTQEPAYGNMAELGFGVLADFGIQPIGQILLDEKLGFHIAFGRSDHFGGRIGPQDFSSPSEVIHLDRIYIPATQPRIKIKSLTCRYEDGREEVLIEEDRYRLW